MTYPGLVKRVPCVVGLVPLEGEAIWCPLDHPQAGVKDAQADERTWYVVLAYDHERLGYWRPSGVELTTTPVNRLWGQVHGTSCAPNLIIPHRAGRPMPSRSSTAFSTSVCEAIRSSCPAPRRASGLSAIAILVSAGLSCVRTDPETQRRMLAMLSREHTHARVHATSVQLRAWSHWRDATPSTASSGMWCQHYRRHASSGMTADDALDSTSRSESRRTLHYERREGCCDGWMSSHTQGSSAPRSHRHAIVIGHDERRLLARCPQRPSLLLRGEIVTRL